MQMHKSRVYVLCDEQGRVARIEGECFLPADLTGWTLVEEGTPCDRLNLVQVHYFDGPLYTRDGVMRHKLEPGKIAARPEAEIKADLDAMSKSYTPQKQH